MIHKQFLLSGLAVLALAVACEVTPTVEIYVTAPELVADYDANEVAADQKYRGKVLEVTGVADGDIKQSMGGLLFVRLSRSVSIESFSSTGVSCFFPVTENRDAQYAQLNQVWTKGQQVTLVGVGDGYSAGSALVRNCSVIR